MARRRKDSTVFKPINAWLTADLEDLRLIPDAYRDVLRNYKYYKVKRIANDRIIENLYYDLENVKGVDYTKEKGTYNENARIENYYKISDHIAEREKENRVLDNVLSGLEKIKDGITDEKVKARIIEKYFTLSLDL